MMKKHARAAAWALVLVMVLLCIGGVLLDRIYDRGVSFPPQQGVHAMHQGGWFDPMFDSGPSAGSGGVGEDGCDALGAIPLVCPIFEPRVLIWPTGVVGLDGEPADVDPDNWDTPWLLYNGPLAGCGFSGSDVDSKGVVLNLVPGTRWLLCLNDGVTPVYYEKLVGTCPTGDYTLVVTDAELYPGGSLPDEGGDATRMIHIAWGVLP